MHKEFGAYMLNDNVKGQVVEIVKAFDALLSTLLEINPEPTREMALCRTKLEEACFFAKKALASRPENHDAVIP